MAGCQMSRCQMSGAKCQVPNVGCQMSGAKCRVPNVGCQLSGAKCRVPNVSVSNVRESNVPVPNVRCQVSSAKSSGAKCRAANFACILPLMFRWKNPNFFFNYVFREICSNVQIYVKSKVDLCICCIDRCEQSEPIRELLFIIMLLEQK